MTGMNIHTGTATIDLTYPWKIRKIQFRIDALTEKVQRHGHHIHVTAPLAVTKQSPLNPVSTGHQRQFSSRYRRTAVIMGMNADQNSIPRLDVAAEPLDPVSIHIRRRHFHR